MSPIEHFWYQLKRRLRTMSPLPRTFQELKDSIQYLYLTHPQDNIRTLIHSMPRRLNACFQVDATQRNTRQTKSIFFEK